ncbi:UDP-N-acetylglucosamine 2-epimerase (non-hydrolyzing) [soil metagenome]
MLHILTVIGARPQIIKAAALSRAIHTRFAEQLRETIVHTGQHYDTNMSQVFFDELKIPAPNYNLQINQGDREVQIQKMVIALVDLIEKEKPDAILVYGDTNSTKAGAEVGKQMQIPVVHIEAGMRSYNNAMPEELNRIYKDQVSALLFSPTKSGVENLRKENIIKGVYHCGDVMYDNSMFFAELAEGNSKILEQQNLQAGEYFLATVHRDFNADDAERLKRIMNSFFIVADKYNLPVILPLHPRTEKQLEKIGLKEKLVQNKSVRIIPPASFLDMIQLEKNAKLILTDSGGVQKEAYFFHKHCVILRPETEWTELIENGAAILADADETKIRDSVQILLNKKIDFPPVFGDGHAAEFICSKMIDDLAGK